MTDDEHFALRLPLASIASQVKYLAQEIDRLRHVLDQGETMSNKIHDIKGEIIGEILWFHPDEAPDGAVEIKTDEPTTTGRRPYAVTTEGNE